jgi:RimJ/RimL family protein N-acetyltransferase
MNFWQGEKVRLRVIEPSDADLIIEWNRDSERGRMMDFLWPPISDFATREWTAKETSVEFKGGDYRWIIVDLADVPVGAINTHNCHQRNGTFEYGVDISPAFKRRGYATEAIKIVARYYFTQLRYQKVMASVHSDNAPSVALHERLGFQLEGNHRRMIFTNDAHIDMLWFGMTADEFAAKHL